VSKAELNIKLAEWAGFEFNDDWASDRPYKSPDGVILYSWKPLTQSLDACFKWLVPKLIEQGCYIQLNTGNYWQAEIWERALIGRQGRYLSDAETPALAFCKAIEKLIDAESK